MCAEYSRAVGSVGVGYSEKSPHRIVTQTELVRAGVPQHRDTGPAIRGRGVDGNYPGITGRAKNLDRSEERRSVEKSPAAVSLCSGATSPRLAIGAALGLEPELVVVE